MLSTQADKVYTNVQTDYNGTPRQTLQALICENCPSTKGFYWSQNPNETCGALSGHSIYQLFRVFACACANFVGECLVIKLTSEQRRLKIYDFLCPTLPKTIRIMTILEQKLYHFAVNPQKLGGYSYCFKPEFFRRKESAGFKSRIFLLWGFRFRPCL